MIFKILTHGASNSAEFLAGLPDEWPRLEVEVPDDTALTPEEELAGWQLVTPEDLALIRATHLAAVDAFYAEWPNTTTARTARRTEVTTTIADFELALANWATLTVAQQKAVLKRCVQALLWIAKEGRVRFDLD